MVDYLPSKGWDVGGYFGVVLMQDLVILASIEYELNLLMHLFYVYFSQLNTKSTLNYIVINGLGIGAKYANLYIR